MAETTIAGFGGFDAWVDNAAVSVSGETTHVTIEDFRRVFDVGAVGRRAPGCTSVAPTRAGTPAQLPGRRTHPVRSLVGTGVGALGLLATRAARR